MFEGKGFCIWNENRQALWKKSTNSFSVKVFGAGCGPYVFLSMEDAEWFLKNFCCSPKGWEIREAKCVTLPEQYFLSTAGGYTA